MELRFLKRRQTASAIRIRGPVITLRACRQSIRSRDRTSASSLCGSTHHLRLTTHTRLLSTLVVGISRPIPQLQMAVITFALAPIKTEQPLDWYSMVQALHIFTLSLVPEGLPTSTSMA